MKKNVLWNTIGTVFYFFCQWILTVIVVRISNYEIAGYFTLAMTMSSSYSTIALFNMRSYQVSDVRGEFNDSTYIASRIGTCTLALFCCMIAAVVAKNSKFQILCIMSYMGIRSVEAMVDVLHGIDQKMNRYDIIGKSYLFRGALTIVFFAVGMGLFNNLAVALCLIVVSTGAVVWFYDVGNLKRIDNIFKVRFDKNIVILLKRCFPTVVISYLLSQENLLPKQMLQNLYGAEQQGIYSTIATPALIVQVCAAVAFSPFLPVFSQAYYNSPQIQFKRLLRKLYTILVGGSAVITIMALLLGKFGLRILYGEGILKDYNIFIPIVWVTIMTAITWIFIAILTAMRKIKTLLIGMIVDFGISMLLMKPCVSLYEKNGVNLIQIISLILYILYMICICEMTIKRKSTKGD